MSQRDSVAGISSNPEYVALSKQLDELKQECCFLRCILISDPDLNPFIKGSSGTCLEKDLEVKSNKDEILQTDRNSLLRDLTQITCQKNNLFKEVENLREDNDDIYYTIETITKEKGELTDELHSIQDDVDVCKSVINFLMSERDQMKKEIDVKDERLSEYYRSISQHSELIIPAQNPIIKVKYNKLESLSNGSPKVT